MTVINLSANTVGIDLATFAPFAIGGAVTGPGGVGAPTATAFETFNGGSTASTDRITGAFTGTGFTYGEFQRPSGGLIATASLSFRDVTFVDPGNVSVVTKTLYITDASAQAAGIATSSGKAFIDRFLTGSDLIMGSAFSDNLIAGAGADTVWAAAGSDTVFGEDGDDYLDGADGFDALFGGVGHDSLIGGAGDDFLEGAAGNDVLLGGAGIDTATFASSSGAITARLDVGYASGQGSDYLKDVENLIGSSFADVLFGSSVANIIWGGAGADHIDGLEGNDILLGEAGRDALVGGLGDDYLNGQADADSLYGNDGHDYLVGEAGDDVLFGDAGYDRLFGGDGADFLSGGDGADTIDGGKGANYALGNAGADVFVFPPLGTLSTTPDGSTLQIADFQDGIDRIDLRGLGLTAQNLFQHTLAIVDYGSGTAITFAGLSGNPVNASSIFLDNIDGHQIMAADFIL